MGMAKRKGERVRWRVVVILEVIKAVCRLCLLRITNSRPLVTPPLPEREQWGKRGWAMGWWAMRGAFYENVTKGFLHGASEKLPSLVSGVLDDYLYLWDGYYFSTSSE